MAATEEKGCYIGRKSCGCVVAAMVRYRFNERETAKELGTWIRQGLSIEQATVEEVRANLKACDCDKKNAKTAKQTGQEAMPL